MSNNLFGLNLPSILASALSSWAGDLILIKTVTTKDPTDSTKYIKTEVPYPCKGWIDNFSNENWKRDAVRTTDVKIVVLGATLTPGVVPIPNDKITAEGKTFTIQADGVMRDATASTYECHGR